VSPGVAPGATEHERSRSGLAAAGAEQLTAEARRRRRADDLDASAGRRPRPCSNAPLGSSSSALRRPSEGERPSARLVLEEARGRLPLAHCRSSAAPCGTVMRVFNPSIMVLPSELSMAARLLAVDVQTMTWATIGRTSARTSQPASRRRRRARPDNSAPCRIRLARRGGEFLRRPSALRRHSIRVARAQLDAAGDGQLLAAPPGCPLPSVDCCDQLGFTQC